MLTEFGIHQRLESCVGYRLNWLDEPVFVAGPKPMRAEFGIHHRLESCAQQAIFQQKARYPNVR